MASLDLSNDLTSSDMVASCAQQEDATAFALVNDSASNAKPHNPLMSNAQTTATDLFC